MHKLHLLTLFALLSHTTLAMAVPQPGQPWRYSGPGKPSQWAELDEKNRACKLGKEQSPINIVQRKVEKAALPALTFDYPSSAGEVLNNGHTIQFKPDSGGQLRLGNTEYQFLQLHLHTPSEEKINRRAYPLGMHFVHQDKQGKLAIVALLFKLGKNNATLAPLFTALPSQQGASTKIDKLDLGAALPSTRSYYTFMGSLTTPPCTEGVRWYVLTKTVEISPEQLHQFKKLYKMNARPVQSLNGRVVQMNQ